LSGVPLTNVPYRGSGAAVTDLIGGQIAAMSSPIGHFLPHLSGGKVRLLAVSGEERSRLAPTVPTYKELGYPLVAREWLGFFLPAGAGGTLVRKCARMLNEALSAPEIHAGVAPLGIEVAPSTPEQLATMLRADSGEWQAIVRKIGFKAET
jgi:tripartite-type tricarboxylate transporter receptor subunit TctC